MGEEHLAAGASPRLNEIRPTAEAGVALARYGATLYDARLRFSQPVAVRPDFACCGAASNARPASIDRPFLFIGERFTSMTQLLIAGLLAQQQQPGGLVGMVLPLAMIGLLFFFMIIRPQQNEQRKREAMLKEIKKNDRVLTSGGIFGVVTNVQPEANEVTVRIDEKNDTKIRMQLSSISRVLTGDEVSETKTE